MVPEKPQLPEPPNPHFKPSPGKAIKFGDGKILNLNRATRRKAKIYNRDLTRSS